MRVGGALDESLGEPVYASLVRLPLIIGNRDEGLAPLRDLDTVRSFMSSQGPVALFDLPWLPIYVLICYFLHPWIGLAALLGAILLVALTVLTEVVTRAPMRAAVSHANLRNNLADASRRNAEALVAMGMIPRLQERWRATNRDYMASSKQAADRAGGFGAASRTLRLMLQSGVLALGAFLVIRGEATAGVIIAGSILSARALAPVDLAITNWRAFVAARQSLQRLRKLLGLMPPAAAAMALPKPHRSASLEGVSIIPPGSQKAVVQDVSFRLERGAGLGILGVSGSGKSTLARALVGVWQPMRGRITIDGATLEQWPADVLAREIG